MHMIVGEIRNVVCRATMRTAGMIVSGIALSMAAQAQLPAGSTYSASNLSPAGNTSSQARGVVTIGANGTLTAGYDSDSNGNLNALLWNGTSNVPVNLNGSLDSSSAYAVSGTSVATSVVVGSGSASNTTHAYLWTGGTASNSFDLNPTGYSYSTANGVIGSAGASSVTVGYGSGTATSGDSHALLWTGSTTTAIDLNPTNLANIESSQATAISGTSGASVTVGIGFTPSGVAHALLWNNTSASAIDLTGSLTTAVAEGVSGTGSTSVTVGYGLGSDNSFHALLWTGASSTAQVLVSTGFSSTFAYGVSGTGASSRTVGYGVDSQSNSHALLWIPSSASAIDLDQYLPTNFTSTYTSTVAQGVDSHGDIVGQGTDNQGHTAAFILNLGTAPEPGSVALLVPGALLPLLALRKRWRGARNVEVA